MIGKKKVCRKCTQNKLIEQFDSYRRVCKACMLATTQDWRAQNKDKVNAWSLERYHRNRFFAMEYLTKNPCVKCEESNPILLDFDHLKDKKFHLSCCGNYSLKKIQQEIDKCQVLCLRCHRLKTATDRGWYQNKKMQELLKPWLNNDGTPGLN